MSDQDSPTPSLEEIRAMTPDEAMRAGAEADGVHITHRADRFPVKDTALEKRLERRIAGIFALSGLAGVGFIVAFVAMPWRWHLPGTPQNFRFYNPILGVTLAVMLLAMGIGMVLWAKWLMPHEEVVQDRHDEPSTTEDRLLTEATFIAGAEDAGVPRRKMLLGTLMLAGGAIATVPLIALLGGMGKKPGKALFVTQFKPRPSDPKFKDFNGLVPLVNEFWRYVGPGDLQPGGIATVFPGVAEIDPESKKDGVHDASSPTLLIRLRPGQKITSRPGQEAFGWPAENPEYVAYSKICTHAGCPASLFEQQTTRLLCPCHQSQFEVLADAKPVFGPATRPLPKLPLKVVEHEGRQIFVAASDYREPIGPSFWDRKDYA